MSKNQINLPKTAFSMKANLPIREPEILKLWKKIDLYKELRNSRKGEEKFVLHDGPPYANGNIHMGTALNKILKDIIVKFHQMDGKDSVYVPGWDCHGCYSGRSGDPEPKTAWARTRRFAHCPRSDAVSRRRLPR